MKPKAINTPFKSLINILVFLIFTQISNSQSTCSLGNPVFIENFGSGTNRLGPSLNQDPNTNVHPNYRPASLYTYVGSGSVSWDQYGIMKDPKDAAPGGAGWNDSFPDHTGNPNGYLYYCDAKEELKVFYAQKIDGLCEDIEYELSAWFAKTNGPNYFFDPNIKLIIGFTDINDQSIGSIVDTNTGPIEGVGANRWHRKSLVFTVPSGTENIYFMLKNNVSGTQGNDLAIDDIEVRPCGPKIDITDQLTNNVINDQSYCLTDTNNQPVSLTANIPASFVMQWQASTELGIWTDITGETSGTLNYTIDSGSFHQLRLKFAHNPDNLLNTNCHFFSSPVSYYRTYANTAPPMHLCDDDNNKTMPFDLTSQSGFINTTVGMTISFHASKPEAEAGTPAIPTPSAFESGNATIFARVQNDANTSCYAISSFGLEVYDSAFPLGPDSIAPISECDDSSVGSDTDGYKVFDLTQRETDILNNQSATDFTLSYFTDATFSSPISDPANFENTVQGGQTIYVRMTNNAFTDCYADTSFEIEVYSLPVTSPPSTYTQCDDSSNDGQAYFNLTLDWIKEEINPNYISEGLSFTYYEDQTEAENGGTNIANPESYQDGLGFATETIWIRIENPNGCSRVEPLDLVVNPSSIALDNYSPNPLYQCDDGLDQRDGIATFDLTDIQDHIETTIFSTINVTAHFYESYTDAELEINEITDTDNYENITSPSQDLWVRVKSDLNNDCLGLKEFPGLLNVEALPKANPVTIGRQCDHDTSDTVMSYPFNTSLVESTVLGSQNPADVNIRYFDESGAELSSPLPNPFLTEGQTITIVVTNNNTQDPDGPCSDETTLEFIVDEQPIIASPVPQQVVCDGDAGDDENDGIYPFDTSNFKGTVLGSQTMAIYFDYIDENGTPVADSPSLPNPLNSSDQTIAVRVINPNNLDCIATTTIDLKVNPLPDFSIVEEEIVCTSDPSFTVLLDPDIANPLDYNYEWVFEDGMVLSNDKALPVSEPGDYTITITNPTTLCPRNKTVSVKASEKASITQDDLTIVDISENNSVTINNPASLGSGTYQFALGSKDGEVVFPYQDSNVFNNVRAGIYTLFVKDDICGTTELDLYVVGYRKFFTPNGDGSNDYWQIQGLSALQANSNIHIYDRFGKLLKQLAPLSQGWDGTFNGTLMPTDDYWFSVVLSDGRNFMGHFTLKR
ncbi:T9SS type B sorting domain-containing protein [Aestuariivivens insulae]|uniref:T9SS type B sorting domain-containing protein n=1 Tax=Aestuariivivens insulae TaxID=1621988 RepID=UPI001F57FAEE|nr:T9SS type B sorting domain-containing protein [Aestuariivivens insulae]